MRYKGPTITNMDFSIGEGALCYRMIKDRLHYSSNNSKMEKPKLSAKRNIKVKITTIIRKKKFQYAAKLWLNNARCI